MAPKKAVTKAAPKGKATKGPTSKRAAKQAPAPTAERDVVKGLEVPDGRSGADEDTAFARNRDVAPPTPAQVAEAAAADAQANAARDFRARGRVKDTADAPGEDIAPRTAFPHPYTGTQVDRTGGIAEITHRAGVYGMDSRDYGSRLEALADAVGAGRDNSMDPRDRWTRLVALHDLLIAAARTDNTIADDNDIVAKAGLATGGRKGKGYTSDNVADVLAQVGLLPGDI